MGMNDPNSAQQTGDFGEGVSIERASALHFVLVMLTDTLSLLIDSLVIVVSHESNCTLVEGTAVCGTLALRGLVRQKLNLKCHRAGFKGLKLKVGYRTRRL